MTMNSTIKCPNCQHEFEATEAFRQEVQDKFRKEAQEWKNRKEEEFQKQLQQSLNQQKQLVEENTRKMLSNEFETKLNLLKENNKEYEEKLRISQAKELEFLKKEGELKTREQELELILQKKLAEERQAISDTIKKSEQEKNSLVLKEYEKKLEDQRKLIEEMQRKADQGSMQLQGEVQELALEELLRNSFPYDRIDEVSKGVKGADCIQFVMNKQGAVCGKIIYESKRTKAFTQEWIEKLKSDMRSQQADIAVIVTETLPRDMSTFGFREGVWICRFSEAKALAFILRDNLIQISQALTSQENKGDKMHMLYDYLTGNEFRLHIEAVMEGFISLKEGIGREKLQMEKIWKEREKQLEKVLLNTTGFYGSIKGIAGNAMGDLKLLEGGFS